ncbi:Cro/C1-type HTH DNA-binding domain protein [Caprobacter fermentans]|uniref:Cro/C1-type HTH DNA-binding domain protein n=1 Tax=Caproicibacter fermentans TaxID=2576756 RepID=A0A6N8I265_9FIRM|nr:helix-turn-helix transcriptional regulator [Caproicibacter fermentans]MVB11985.1 Cro/C1-type HTH DNA-binding domain protein [Caproicibacter fermentans]
MVSFEPLRKLMENRKISTYFLRNKCGDYNLDSKTIQRLMNDESVSTNTIDALCQIFKCQVSDIIEILPDPEKGNNA